MATNQDNIFKVLEDLQYRAIGVDPTTKQMQEGYFAAFRDLGLPIFEEDFKNPYSPVGSNKVKIDAPATFTTGSAQLTEESVTTADDISDAYKSFLNTFMLLDTKIELNNEYRAMPGATRVSDSWYAIINGAQALQSKGDLNAEIKKAIEDAQAVLYDATGEETPHYKKYLEFQEKYENASNDLIDKFTEANSDPIKMKRWGERGITYIRKKDSAFKDWGSFGFKSEIETARDFLNAQGEDPATLLISKSKTDFENSLIAVGELGTFPYTFILPSNWYKEDTDNWTTYNESEFHNKSTFKKTTSSIQGGGGWGGFFSASGGKSKTITKYDNISSNLSISMEICVADVFRMGINTALLGLNNWFLNGVNYPKKCISNGTFSQEKPTNSEGTFLPSLVTSIILVKNLKITMNDADSNFNELIDKKGGGGSLNLGLFSLGGSASTGNKEREFESTITAKEIIVPGVQLVGYVNTILPESPMLDSKDYVTASS